jgi:hypothetical protein
MKTLLIGLLTLSSFSTFANTNCVQELDTLKEHLVTLKNYDVSAYWKIEGNSRLIRDARGYPSLVKDYANNLNNYSQTFQSARIELRTQLDKSVQDLESCINN